jgi:apolipoprotein N-acyltransferase
MHWFKSAFYLVGSVLFLAFVAWIATRILQLHQANHIASQVIVYDLYAVGVLLAYSAFVGGFHLWEKLTGRMEPTQMTSEADADSQPRE